MADIIKTTKQLKIGFNDHADKVKYITLNNPKSSLTAEQIRDAANYIVTNQLLLDSEDIPYGSVETAYTENKSVREFDLD